jgi:hypothetical protein
MNHRHPYIGEGADGARRSGRIDLEEADGLDPGEARDACLASADRWQQQAEELEADERRALGAAREAYDRTYAALYEALGEHILDAICGGLPSTAKERLAVEDVYAMVDSAVCAILEAGVTVADQDVATAPILSVAPRASSTPPTFVLDPPHLARQRSFSQRTFGPAFAPRA